MSHSRAQSFDDRRRALHVVPPSEGTPVVRGQRGLRVNPSALQLGFAALIGLMLAAHAGGAVRYLYPVLGVAVAAQLLRISTADYIGFVIWMWMLSPLVRRMADLQAGWQDPSLILLTPYLVSGAGLAGALAMAMVRSRPTNIIPRNVGMFLLAGIGVVSSIPMGFASHNPGAALETLNWLVPIALGAYIATHGSDDLEAIEKVVVSALTRGGIVVGVYGIYQFFYLPSWDANWMEQADMASIGSPVPFEVRVFSTMHSPGVMAYYLLFPLLLGLANPRARALVPACLAMVVLLLSQVRSAWVGFVVAAILIFSRIRLGNAVRVALLSAIGFVVVSPFLQLSQVSELVNKRFETLSDMPRGDASAEDRIAGHERTLAFLATHPLGAGIGAQPRELEMVAIRDSTPIAVLVQFGVFGSFMYLSGLVLLAVNLWRYYRRASRLSALGLGAIGLGMLCMAILGVPSAGVEGMLLWIVGGMAAAASARERVPARTTRVVRYRYAAGDC